MRGPQEAAKDDAIDPATLPPIESLGAESDYTVFLEKGVPEALRLAALRKAWMSDPFIRDFRSPAIDYGWDFTTPDYALRPGDDVAKLLDRIFPPAAPEPAKAPAALPAETDAAGDLSAKPEVKPLPHIQAAPSAPEPSAEPSPAAAAPRRKHGGALPKDVV